MRESRDGGGNDGAATVASALVVMTTFFRNVPGLVRDVTQRRHRCRRRVAAVPHHSVEKRVFRRRCLSVAPLRPPFHQDGSRAITGNAAAAANRTISIVSRAEQRLQIIFPCRTSGHDKLARLHRRHSEDATKPGLESTFRARSGFTAGSAMISPAVMPASK